MPGWSQQSVADKLIAEGHYARARLLVQAALEKDPREINALVALSTIQWAFGQLDASTSTAERAVLASDGSPVAHAQLLNTLGAKLASSKIGTIEKMSLARRFRKEADRTLQLDPKNLYAHEALARFYWYAPAIVGGGKAKARQMVDNLTQLDAVHGYALKAELDATETDIGKTPAAVQSKVQLDWKRATAASPDSYTARIGLGGSLLAGDHLREAEGEAQKALAIDPSRAAAYRLLAAVYVTSARWDDLESNLKRARAAVPDDLGAELTAAQTILDRDIASQWSRAEEYLRNYLQQPSEGLQPSLAVAHWRLATVLEKEGRNNAALGELQTAVNLDPTLDGAKQQLKKLR
jgi:tetratricopeptide (TPR) repeat protein